MILYDCQDKRREVVDNMWGVLTGNEIANKVSQGEILISPYDKHNISCNSYNYRLANKIIRLNNEVFDLKHEDTYEEIIIKDTGTILYPNECYLGSTLEKVGSNNYVGLITGKSSIGRKFITNHMTSNIIEQGLFGNITLEITVQKPTILYPNILFGHIMWLTVLGSAKYYEGEYQNQNQPTVSNIHNKIVDGLK